MGQDAARKHFPTVGDGSGLAQTDSFHKAEIQLALRNRGIPLEGLRYPITPTGLHYLLTHYDIPEMNANDWRLKVSGLVSEPLSLTLEDIKDLPAQTAAVTMECSGNGRALLTPRRISQPWLLEAVGTAEWTGTSLRGVLEQAGIRHDANEIVFTGLDRGVEGDQVQNYQRSLSVSEATRDEVLLAYEMNREPLPPQHGYPHRLLVPGWYGMASVKWLDRIEPIAGPFRGYHMVRAFRYSQAAEDFGEPVTLMRVRALMIPPGIPNFLTRTRLVQAGPVNLTGRAWAGRLSVSRVEVSTNGGSAWSDAELGDPVSPHAWRAWTFPWNARPGTHTLCVRATDSDGDVQPLDGRWDLRGYGNNAVQRVSVMVE